MPRRPRAEDIEEIVRKQVERVSQPLYKKAEPYRLSILNSLLFEEIISRCFPKKFVIPSFEHYLGATNLIYHLRQYQDKMVVHFHDDVLMGRVFPSSLKGFTYD